MTKNELCSKGMKLLRNGLGLLESEIFINLILKDSFDYTTWRETQWKDETIDDIWTVAENNGMDKNRGN